MSQQNPTSRRTFGSHPALSISPSIVGVALAGMARWLLAFWLVRQFQSARCPENTFLSCSNEIANLLQGVPLLFPAFGVGLPLYNWVVLLLTKRPHPTRQSRGLRWALVLLLLALPVSVAASLCAYCLKPDAILIQAYLWSGFREYAWEDVAPVTTACHYSGGRSPGWRKQFILTMRDGVALDLMTREDEGVRAHPAVIQALNRQAFSFDPSGVARQCPQLYLCLQAA
jgi:hypothetical protein